MEDSEQDKTEQASRFKLRKAREKGTVARGSDIGPAVGLVALIGYFSINGESFFISLSKNVRMVIITAPQIGDRNSALIEIIGEAFSEISRHLGFFAALVWGMALLFDFIQTGPVFSAKPMIPDFSRINPAEGLKRIFSVRALIEAVKSSFKFIIYILIGWILTRNALNQLLPIVDDSQKLAQALASTTLKLLFGLCLAGIFFAIIDQIITRRQFGKKMRMSRRETKREHKDQEGDPRVKGRRKKLHGDFLKITSSLRAVRDADIIIVNPEHFAVALMYDAKIMIAPKVIACGSGWLAIAIKKVAIRYGVLIIEDRNLVRKLYFNCKLNCEINNDFYQSVANIYNSHKIKREN
jgi:flagellar biosynthesis protein FlhB